MNTWSWRSTQTPPNPPKTHRSGNGFGQDRSISYFGAPLWPRNSGGQTTATATAKIPHAHSLISKLVVFVIVVSLVLDIFFQRHPAGQGSVYVTFGVGGNPFLRSVGVRIENERRDLAVLSATDCD